MDYRCPHCLGELQSQENKLACLKCQREFPLRENLPQFGIDQNFYYGELPQEKMAELITLAEKTGWQPAFRQLLKMLPEHKKPQISQYAMDGTRAAWKYLLDHKPAGRALDFGCGWSNISICLSRSFGTVYAMDLTWERLKFLQLKAAQLKRDNIIPLLGGDTPHFPFPDNYFDAVTLNGVLEWVPVSKAGDPREVQKELLREIRRILKPDGQLYIGIENRIGFLYFFGRPEDHTGLLFGSLLPRPLADLYMRLKKGRPYRTYIYSRAGYQKLLTESGFDKSRFYSPVPDYRDFHQILDLESEQTLNPFFSQRRLRDKVKHWLYGSHTFNPSFSIVTSTKNQRSFVEGLLQEIETKLSEKLVLEKYLVSRTNNVILLCQGKSDLVVKLPLNEAANGRTRNHHDTLGRLQKTLKPAEATLIPRPLLSATYQGQNYYVESKLPGISCDRLVLDEPLTERLLAKALSFITTMQEATKIPVTLDAARLEVLYGQAIANIEPQIADEPQLREFFTRLASYLTTQLQGRSLNLVQTHGDFWLGNVLTSPAATELTGVIDWDIAREQGWPLLDLWHLLGYTQKLRNTKFSWGQMYTQIIWPEKFSAANSQILAQYSEQLGITPELLPPLKVCYWLNYLAEYMRYFLYVDSYWEKENLYQVVDFLKQQLKL